MSTQGHGNVYSQTSEGTDAKMNTQRCWVQQGGGAGVRSQIHRYTFLNKEMLFRNPSYMDYTMTTLRCANKNGPLQCYRPASLLTIHVHSHSNNFSKEILIILINFSERKGNIKKCIESRTESRTLVHTFSCVDAVLLTNTRSWSGLMPVKSQDFCR